MFISSYIPPKASPALQQARPGVPVHHTRQPYFGLHLKALRTAIEDGDIQAVTDIFKNEPYSGRARCQGQSAIQYALIQKNKNRDLVILTLVQCMQPNERMTYLTRFVLSDIAQLKSLKLIIKIAMLIPKENREDYFSKILAGAVESGDIDWIERLQKSLPKAYREAALEAAEAAAIAVQDPDMYRFLLFGI